jgi:hypothetical protein
VLHCHPPCFGFLPQYSGFEADVNDLPTTGAARPIVGSIGMLRTDDASVLGALKPPAP